MQKTAVVILNWNGRSWLEKFLPSVVKYSSDEADIIIADNGSGDDSIAFIREHFPQIKIIRHHSNLGFSKGYNDALKQVEAEYYILLNSDVEVTPNWIKPVIELMDNDSNIAVCQPKLKSYNDKTFFEYAGAAGGFIDKLGYPFCRGRIFGHIEEDKGQYDDVMEIFWATGACMFVRAELYFMAGGLDDDFFAHMEEIDLCWRLKNEGYKIMYCPYSTVYHAGGGSLPKNNPRKTYLNFRNNLILLYKNSPACAKATAGRPPKKLVYILLVRFLLDGIAAVKFLFADGITDFFAVIKAHFSFYLYLCKSHKHQVPSPKHQVPKGIYNKSIVIEYYLRGKKTYLSLFNQGINR